ncbi:hypothetical protein D3C76_1522340 [compost metagenome]
MQQKPNFEAGCGGDGGEYAFRLDRVNMGYSICKIWMNVSVKNAIDFVKRFVAAF